MYLSIVQTAAVFKRVWPDPSCWWLRPAEWRRASAPAGRVLWSDRLPQSRPQTPLGWRPPPAEPRRPGQKPREDHYACVKRLLEQTLISQQVHLSNLANHKLKHFQGVLQVILVLLYVTEASSVPAEADACSRNPLVSTRRAWVCHMVTRKMTTKLQNRARPTRPSLQKHLLTPTPKTTQFFQIRPTGVANPGFTRQQKTLVKRCLG